MEQEGSLSEVEPTPYDSPLPDSPRDESTDDLINLGSSLGDSQLLRQSLGSETNGEQPSDRDDYIRTISRFHWARLRASIAVASPQQEEETQQTGKTAAQLRGEAIRAEELALVRQAKEKYMRRERLLQARKKEDAELKALQKQRQKRFVELEQIVQGEDVDNLSIVERLRLFEEFTALQEALQAQLAIDKARDEQRQKEDAEVKLSPNEERVLRGLEAHKRERLRHQALEPQKEKEKEKESTGELHDNGRRRQPSAAPRRHGSLTGNLPPLSPLIAVTEPSVEIFPADGRLEISGTEKPSTPSPRAPPSPESSLNPPVLFVTPVRTSNSDGERLPPLATDPKTGKRRRQSNNSDTDSSRQDPPPMPMPVPVPQQQASQHAKLRAGDQVLRDLIDLPARKFSLIWVFRAGEPQEVEQTAQVWGDKLRRVPTLHYRWVVERCSSNEAQCDFTVTNPSPLQGRGVAQELSALVDCLQKFCGGSRCTFRRLRVSVDVSDAPLAAQKALAQHLLLFEPGFLLLAGHSPQPHTRLPYRTLRSHMKEPLATTLQAIQECNSAAALQSLLPPVADRGHPWTVTMRDSVDFSLHPEDITAFSALYPWLGLVLYFVDNSARASQTQMRIWSVQMRPLQKEITATECAFELFNTVVRHTPLYQLFRGRADAVTRRKLKPFLQSSPGDSGGWRRSVVGTNDGPERKLLCKTKGVFPLAGIAARPGPRTRVSPLGCFVPRTFLRPQSSPAVGLFDPRDVEESVASNTSGTAVQEEWIL
eukprot:TRINITY_DN24333_c0_g1_i1.p1 TRINITY_DN24333_c0_g1~~TRINITY_DN24333_c0_g1_i1.p1  ORF type:complete len:766 (-),score=117.92 TRINITY_DN24333_c0_g1_i1:9-2306(-)